MRELAGLESGVLLKYEGECVGILDNKVVSHGKNAGKILDELLRKYKGRNISIACVPVKTAKIVR